MPKLLYLWLGFNSTIQPNFMSTKVMVLNQMHLISMEQLTYISLIPMWFLILSLLIINVYLFTSMEMAWSMDTLMHINLMWLFLSNHGHNQHHKWWLNNHRPYRWVNINNETRMSRPTYQNNKPDKNYRILQPNY